MPLEGARLERVASRLLVASVDIRGERTPDGGIPLILVQKSWAWTLIRLKAGVAGASVIVATRRNRMLLPSGRRLGRRRRLRLIWEKVWPLLKASKRARRSVGLAGLDRQWVLAVARAWGAGYAGR